MGENDDEKNTQAGQLFENFVQASTGKGTIQAFNILCRQLELDPLDFKSFYAKLKSKVTTWKAKALWNKLDKRASHKEYKKGNACTGTKCLIIGGGPCGLRTAIELALLGAKVVVIEKRDTFSRNNVLHLWPYTIHDLRGLGAKKFYGKFCAGAIDHISIRQLQLMLLKVALLLAVEIHVNVEFVKLLEPPEEQENEGPGWRAEIRPADHPVADFDFDVIVGADGRRNTLEGFRRKEFRGKLAIAITANFINRNTTAEAKVEEISGVAFIFNQKFFQDLKEETGVDLENIVYYKDDTHYFVMTAKKQSLLDKEVIIHDYIDTEKLLSSNNVNQEALLSYAREAADFGTNYQLPSLDYAINHYGQPDVAMFDFTCMYASENAALVRERFGHQLLVALVGDSLLEPFWPMGTGCARGFLAAFDTAWMVKSWAEGKAPLEMLAERESVYRLLPQTTPENITKNFEQYTIDPATRYPNLNSNCVRPLQVRHLYITGELQPCTLERAASVRRSVNLSRHESEIRPNRLLTWCQKQTEGYRNVIVSDLTTSWKSGLALCALIHSFRADLVDFDSLNEEDSARNNQLAFDIAEQEFGIPPVTTGKEMAADRGPDKLSMVMYLSKFYELFQGSPVQPPGIRRKIKENNEQCPSKPANSVYSNLITQTLPRKRIPKVDKKLEDSDYTSKRRRRGCNHLEEVCLKHATNLSSQSLCSVSEGGEGKVGGNQNKVKSMANQLIAKFEENAPSCTLRRQGSMRKEFPQNLGGSDTCHFCKKRVYVMERLSTEGRFFHRECFRCDVCNTTLRLGAYAFDVDEGKFYCKPHFTQRKTSVKHRKRRVDLEKDEKEVVKQEDSGASAQEAASTYSAMGSLESRPPGGCFQRLSNSASPKKSRSVVKGLTSQSCPALSESSSVTGVPEEALHNRIMTDSSYASIESSPHWSACKNEEVPDASDSPRTSVEFQPHLRRCELLTDENGAQEYSSAVQPSSSFNRNSRWRRKIQATLPLTMVKKKLIQHPEDTSPTPKDSGKEEESKSESLLGCAKRHIPSSGITDVKTNSSPLSLRSTDRGKVGAGGWGGPSSAYVDQEMMTTKKKLTLSNSQKAKLLDWNLNFSEDLRQQKGAREDKSSWTGKADSPSAINVPVAAAPKPRAQPPQSSKEANKTPQSGLQLLANALRRSFRRSGGASSSGITSNTESSPPRPQPVSDGSFFNFAALFGGPSCDEQLSEPTLETDKRESTQGRIEDTAPPHSASAVSASARCSSELVQLLNNTGNMGKEGLGPQGVENDMPKLLEKVSLNEMSSRATKDDLTILPRRRLNFFSSLRLKRSEGTERGGEGADEVGGRNDIWAILAKFKKKDSDNLSEGHQADHYEASSSSEEEKLSSKQKVSSSHLGSSSPRQRRKQEKMEQRQARHENLKRLHRAQVIQRQLEEVEERQRVLEERGVKLEKELRGETDSSSADETQLLQTWFKLVLEKNKLVRYESELMIFAQELELEDCQSQLQQKLRRRMAIHDSKKSPQELAEEQQVLGEMMRMVEERDRLVVLLEEQRLQERAEDKDLESFVLSKGYQLNWM
ncbi:F-actin-monooxygenase mical2b-like isoform X7 [Lepisosteus oculatus]|uniref:F-actin-monooxygenase mical2b-like isoform X7 n=1 Tax=Lepisosteus oculatus TaxID=7918 RepID=UPI0035F513D7